jgi:hypothetical protein
MENQKDEVVRGADDPLLQKNKNWSRRLFIRFSVLTIVAVVIGYGIAHFQDHATISSQNLALSTTGQVALTESQLITAVRDAKATIYWVGPQGDTRYLLTIDKTGSGIIRYIPISGAVSSATTITRTVATYSANGAYEKSVSVSTKVGTSTFQNADKSLVFYKNADTNDVFMAFPGKNFQVEIFDPVAGQALSLAVLAGQVRPVA